MIGSLADLEGAELADVVDFHRKWYGPNNATLVVAGDLDVEQTREWIERYFGEIPARPLPEAAPVPEVRLDHSTLLFHEDNYARLPMLTLAWPSVPLYHPDSYPLEVLGRVVADGKSTPLHEVLVEEAEVAPAVSVRAGSSELAGRVTLTVRAYAGMDLDSVFAAVGAAFDRFEAQGVPPEELQRVKAGYETEFYGGLSSVLGKAFTLAGYEIFAGDAGYASEDLERLLAVTEADVRRVYERYVKDRPFVATSFVPRGQAELALTGSERAEVVEESIVMGAEAELGEVHRGDERTPSAIDRSVEPPFGDPPTLVAPRVWRGELDDGVPVLGIEDHEVPLVSFQLRMEGGQLLDDPSKVGVANLLAESMMAGTATKTPEELEAAIDLIGASVDVSAGAQAFVIRGSTLARNYPETMRLVEEILLEPRFDAEEFALAQQRVRSTLEQRASSPVAISGDVFQRLLYGDHVLAANGLGDLEAVDRITLDDLRGYHARALTPALASFQVTGAVDRDEVMASLEGIATRWGGEAPSLPAAPEPDPTRAGLYFVDVPNASQSVLQIGYLALAETDDDFYPATVMNFRLGGGGFASELLQVLREQRGYTYGIGSSFSGTEVPGPFRISSSVRSNVTYEALDLIKGIVEGHGPEFDDGDLETTQGFLLRANARAFETAGAKLGLLADMSDYGFPADYVLQREQVVREMTVPRIRELAERYLAPERMIWLVVGDARTQLARLDGLGLGQATLLDRNGVPIG